MHAPIEEILCPLIASIKTQEIIAAAAAVLVVANAFTPFAFTPNAAPALKPNQPNQSKPVPIIT